MKKAIWVVGLAVLVVLALNGPVAVSDEATVSEETVNLYNKKCGMCHGKDGVAKSMAKGSANLNDPAWQEATSLEDVITVINDGKGKMKGLKDKLSAEEIEAVAVYAKQLK